MGLLQFVTDEEHWNEELLLQFYATLHIKGYNKDPKTWFLEWMTGNVHHEANAFDILAQRDRQEWATSELNDIKSFGFMMDIACHPLKDPSLWFPVVASNVKSCIEL